MTLLDVLVRFIGKYSGIVIQTTCRSTIRIQVLRYKEPTTTVALKPSGTVRLSRDYPSIFPCSRVSVRIQACSCSAAFFSRLSESLRVLRLMLGFAKPLPWRLAGKGLRAGRQAVKKRKKAPLFCSFGVWLIRNALLHREPKE